MTDDRFERIRDLFLRALAVPAAEREAFLAGGTDDPGVREEVASLLRARDEADVFLEKPALEVSDNRWVGRRIGAYRIEEILARGGMGLVFRAHQEAPGRQVALKLIRSDLPSERTLKRFALEAEVLGLLDHPDIARIYEAGTVDTGSGPQPFFAMELVEGLPLTSHVGQNDLSTEERVRLMARVARAVQHAHEKGVVHRDLKPANILVREDGSPRILDFGVARVTDPDVQTTRLTTLEGQVLGTLAYMSPEQVLAPGDTVDGRADVYSLGVLLFELLTGRLPRPLDGASLVEAARLMADSEPSTLSEGDTRFPRDLETIVGKALELDPDRRYATARRFAEDLERFLAHEPISARPPSTVYQFGKFARRNRGLVAGTGLAAIALVAGLAVSVAGWTRAERDRERAEVETAKAETLNRFLIDMLEAPDPWADGADVRVVEVLERTGARVDSVLADQPEVAIQAHTTLATTYNGLTQYSQAEPHFVRALDLAGTHLEQDDPARFLQLRNYGQFLIEDGRVEEAERLAEGTRALLSRVGEGSAEALEGLHFLAMFEEAQGNVDSSRVILERCLALSSERLGPDHPSTESTRQNLGNVYMQLDRMAEARAMLEPVYESRKVRLGPDHPSTLIALNNLAFIHKDLGQHDRALAMFERSLEARLRIHGEPSLSAGVGRHNLALQLGEMGRGEEALPHHDAAIAHFQELFGPDHLRAHIARAAKGGTYFRMDRPREAEPLLRTSHAGMTELLPPDHWRLEQLAGQLVEVYEALGDEASAAAFRPPRD